MAVRDIVVDQSLLPVLNSSAVTREQCDKLLALLDPSGDSASSNSQETVLVASREQKQLFALLARLRGLNREAILRVRETKQSTAEARQEIDRLHLQLQNLYYEQRHLTGEIAACESYDHKYLSLPLIPVEEFLTLFPEHRDSDAHELMIARINHEHAEREKLEQARQELLKRKQALIAENNKRKEDLASLDQDLERFIDHVLVMTSKNEDPGSSQTTSTPANDTMSSKTGARRLPPPEKSEAIQTRFKVIAAFWAVIIFLGFPIWWKTTSIYRARLPIQDMVEWADGKTCRPVFPLEIHFETPSLPESEAHHLLRTTQHTLDDLNEFSAHHLRLKLSEENSPALDGRADNALTVRLLPQEDLAAPRSELHPDTTRLDVYYPPSQIPPPSASNPPLSAYIAGELQNLFTEEKAIIAQVLSDNNVGGANTPTSSSNNQQQPSAILNSISPQLAESITRRLRRSMKYAETYHLAFSLFTPGSEPSSWDVKTTVEEYISPLLQAFAPISNFTVDTQVQLYATSAPTAPLPVYDETQAAWMLKKEDLSAFINAAEWPLSPSIGSGPTINFILYVPAPSQSPMVVEESSATSWIIPQWGGVFLLNPLSTADHSSNPPHLSQEALRPAFLTFSHQLLTLLGAPATPASLPFRLQTLIRIRAATLLLSASSTMGSLARLTESLPSIPIPANVATSVSTTLSHLASTCEHLREGRFQAALADARVAETEAERSFFEKSMVGQVYFPDEHKVAVYLPLLGPIGVPLIVGLLKEVKRVVAGLKAEKQQT
ncbi:phosphatidylinositol-glycan biosynthesis class S protein-domain-containing protein [Aspergillus transmontanensis]|uniref:Phosphatidylinositol-glycan biosynthesis class S protein-domain-containing protein n=1 Tax=Aspergillus transmontanensis TaxID=1034304 RepID=A0A5N6VWI6_9EURO|nr:phosphatidylinositol-glycan biosynthesis class S protein-domain-containing protein [Aspergillus transmontanensis]